ncbi:MAG: HAMP domain-containing protein [Phycisphaerae bacterium]|nr:HAMP domain-containing protein [Phycisphaerae bacterium]
MKVGIRTKLVVLLVVVALLPLLAALLTIVIGGRHLRAKTFGQNILAVTKSEAYVMQTGLIQDIGLLKITLLEPTVFAKLEESNRKLPAPELATIDASWATTPENTGLLYDVINNPIADILKRIVRRDNAISELIITDRFGQLIAASNRTTDYYQGDEEWWVKAYNGGQGKIYIPSIEYDKSTKIWAASLCIPIIDNNGKFLGVAKGVLDIHKWLPEAERKISGGRGSIVILGEGGYLLHYQDLLDKEPDSKKIRAKDWEIFTSVGPQGAWRETSDGTVEAYTVVELPEDIGDLEIEMSKWTLLMTMKETQAHKSLATRLNIMVMLIGLFSISVLFMIGVLLIDRSLINRIRRISQSARRVAEGDLRHRADGSWRGTRIFGTDEITELARDFNNMVRRLQRSHTELTEANQLKENFIRIAGHELRTPVSYIVGMSTLMKSSRDPERLAKAIDTMGFKARRLDEIIQAMFKLIPEQALSEGLKYRPVSLSTLLEKIYIDCKPWIERRNQTLIIEPGEQDTIIHADEAKLRDIIENLVMNAIKFTPNEGLIKIVLQRQLGGYVAIEVIDQGPGIPESERPHVFEPFYSGEDILKHSTGKSGFGKRGMGLGLAIVKHFVDQHGGMIDFLTTPTGTTFVVQLPIEPSNIQHRPTGPA